MDIPYEDSLLHTRWINGILYLRECNPEEDIALIQSNVRLLSTVAIIAIDNYADTTAAMVSAMGVMLRLGYYLGQKGIGADAPMMTPEFVRREIEPRITPNCDCGTCQAKIDLLKEYGIECEVTPERQELADTIEEEKQVRQTINDTLPPDDFNPCVN